MSMKRRAFLRQAVQGALAARLATAAEARDGGGAEPAGPPALPIVDTHQHLWDLTKLRLPWVKSSTRLNRSFVTKDYLEASRGLNVVKAVYMEVAVEPEQLVLEAKHVLELCKRPDNPTCAAVIGGRPADDAFKEYIGRFKDNPYVKGVRQMLFSSAGLCLTDAFTRGVQLLGELGLSFDLCVSPAQLGNGLKLVTRCPDTRFIIDHCGNADPKAFSSRPAASGARSHDPGAWRRDMGRLAQKKNTVCKISGIVARAPKDRWTADDLAPIIDHCLQVFGPDRVLFGSDWPVCTRVATLRDWVKALKEVIRSRSEREQRKLLHDNAVRFYGLK